MSIIAIINQKGGVGKTTTVINLAAAVSAMNRRVLIVDMDPQGNASTGLGVSKPSLEQSSYAVLIGIARAQDVIVQTAFPNLSIIPSNIHLAATDIEICNLDGREKKLLDAIGSLNYDYIFIDCPPGFGLINLNILYASNKIIIPLQCEFYALEGLAQLFQTISQVRNSINQNLLISGIILTMFDRRNNMSLSIEKDVRGHFKDLVYKTMIPRNVRVSEASSFGKPVIAFDVNCAGSISYINMAKEFLMRDDGI